MGARFEALDEGVLAAASKSTGYFFAISISLKVRWGMEEQKKDQTVLFQTWPAKSKCDHRAFGIDRPLEGELEDEDDEDVKAEDEGKGRDEVPDGEEEQSDGEDAREDLEEERDVDEQLVGHAHRAAFQGAVAG